jgi:NAD(P)-dependent dehydrogenase (short-subunit alcohol dehydrogenase family)
MQLRDRVALVTGAGSGIGKASAVLLAREGAKVAALSRTREELEKTVKEIEDAGGEGLVVVADTSEPDEVEDAVRQVVERWGRLDVVFANAGVNGVWAPIEELEVDEWRKTVDINLTGTFLTLKYSMPHLKQRGGSVIVNASVNGTRVFSNSGATAYASTKAAQVAMTKMLALEVARHRVRVNVICPGAIDTEIDDNTERRDLDGIGVPQEFPEGPHPLTGKPGTSQEVAQLVLFLASDASRHVTGTEIWIDGGESLLGLKG